MLDGICDNNGLVYDPIDPDGPVLSRVDAHSVAAPAAAQRLAQYQIRQEFLRELLAAQSHQRFSKARLYQTILMGLDPARCLIYTCAKSVQKVLGNNSE